MRRAPLRSLQEARQDVTTFSFRFIQFNLCASVRTYCVPAGCALLTRERRQVLLRVEWHPHSTYALWVSELLSGAEVGPRAQGASPVPGPALNHQAHVSGSQHTGVTRLVYTSSSKTSAGLPTRYCSMRLIFRDWLTGRPWFDVFIYILLSQMQR